MAEANIRREPAAPDVPAGAYITCLLMIFIIICAITAPAFWPSLIPFPLNHYWFWHGTLSNIALDALPSFVLSITIPPLIVFIMRKRILSYLKDNNSTWLPSTVRRLLPLKSQKQLDTHEKRYINLLIKNPFAILRQSLFGSIASIFLGRWFLFYSYCVALSVLNHFSFGLIQWFYLTLARPFADIVTLHMLHADLYQLPWVIGAAVVLPVFYERNALKAFPFWLLLSWYISQFFLILVFLRHGLYPILFVEFIISASIRLLTSAIIQSAEKQQKRDDEPVQPEDTSIVEDYRRLVDGSPPKHEPTGLHDDGTY